MLNLLHQLMNPSTLMIFSKYLSRGCFPIKCQSASKPSGLLATAFEGVVASFRDADGQEVAVKRVPGHPVTMVCLDDVHVIWYNMI